VISPTIEDEGHDQSRHGSMRFTGATQLPRAAAS